MGMLEIRTHKMRSFLSFLGVMVGVASVMLTLAFLQGAQERMRKGLELSGPGRLELEATMPGGGFWDDEYEETKGKLVMGDVEAIAREFPELPMVAPRIDGWGGVTIGELRKDMPLLGVTPAFSKRDWIYTVRGRFFNAEDLRRFAKVCVLVQKGAPGKKSWWRKYWADYLRDPVDKVFQRGDPLGQTIVVNRTAMTVVGVLREPDEDDDPRWFKWGMHQRVLLPLTTMQKYLTDSQDRVDRVDDIQIDTGEERTVPFYTSAILRLVESRHPRSQGKFTIRNRAEMMQQSMQELRKAHYMFMGVGIISLIAGGIGIMNVALAVVFSRIREIGIRRAVGARRLDILVQFILESVLLAALGGLAGVGLGALGAWQIPKHMREMEAVVTPAAVLLCLGISVGVGVFFSIYPAWQAAKLDPVEALRYE